MKNITRHSGKLGIIRRENNSVNGNPRYLCQIDGYTFYTAPDSSYGYSIKNHEEKNITVTLGTHRGRLTLNSIEE